MRFFKFFILSIFFIFSCKSLIERKIDFTSKSYEIRVLLRSLNHDKLIFSNKNGFQVIDFITKKRINIKSKKITIFLNNNRVFLNNFYISSPLFIYANGLTKVNDRYYAGYFKIVPLENNFYVINYISIESYLISVVASEMPVTCHIEALKAQTVIARTYSYYFMLRSTTKDFDVDDTIFYQVYNGFNLNFKKEIVKKIFKAIKDTEGLILTFNGEPIIAYFHSNSGGMTVSGKEYFGNNSDFPYLISKLDPYSIDMPYYIWSFEIYRKVFLNTLNISDVSIDLLESNFIYNDNGFIKELNINNNIFSAKDIRRIIGYNKIKSEKFRVTINGESILFDGYGYGHGVGLSQWGAENMARQQKKFKEILSFYYPNTKIENF